jgi:hypothetical protein
LVDPDTLFVDMYDVDFTRNVQRHFADFVRVYRRNDPLEEFSALDALQLFNSGCDYWRGFLLSSEIDLIYFSVVPHQSLEFLLSLVAEELHISCLYFHDINSLGRKILVNDYKSDWRSIVSVDPQSDCSVVAAEESRILNKFNLDLRLEMSPPIWLEQFNGIRDNRWDRTFLSEFKLFCRLFIATLISGITMPSVIFLRRSFLSSETALVHLKRSLSNRFTSNSYINARIRYRQLCSSILPKQFYAYFLNYEPEMMVNPLGGQYDNQMLAIAQIHQTLPPGMALVVKEHPLQFKSEIGFGYLGRTTYFYDFLSSLPNVVLVGEQFSSQEIIDKSTLVLTLNGTVGWEALCRSKPVAVLGGIWYQGAPGTCNLDEIKNPLEVAELISEDHSEELRNFFGDLCSRSFFLSFSSEAARSIGVDFCFNHSQSLLKMILLKVMNAESRLSQ